MSFCGICLPKNFWPLKGVVKEVDKKRPVKSFSLLLAAGLKMKPDSNPQEEEHFYPLLTSCYSEYDTTEYNTTHNVLSLLAYTQAYFIPNKQKLRIPS